MKKQLSELFKKESHRYMKSSYAQSGEDLIVKFIFDRGGILTPRYMDIGAYHPYKFSNTALFYQLGSRGVNIEPDPNLFQEFLKYRKDDINLNIGIGAINGHQDFYILNSPTLNTFSKEVADNYASEGNYTITKVVRLEVKTWDKVLEQIPYKFFPDFLSIDAEGIDELVIKSINFVLDFPKVICVETVSFSTNGKGIKNNRLIEYIVGKGYIHYADTYINSIFVKEKFWYK